METNVVTKPLEINASMDFLSMHISNTIQNSTTTQIVGSITNHNMKSMMLCHTMNLYFFYGVLIWTLNASLPPIGHIIFSNMPWNVNNMEQLIWTKKMQNV